MMKYKPYAIVGVLFVVLFLVTVFAFQCGGVWDPPGNRAGDGSEHNGDHEAHDDHDEVIDSPENHEHETTEVEYISDTLRGSLNLLEFLNENDIPVDCVSEKLELSNPQLDASAGDIKDSLGIEMSDIRTAIDTCLGLELREFDHDEEDGHTGNDIDINDESDHDHDHGEGEGSGQGSGQNKGQNQSEGVEQGSDKDQGKDEDLGQGTDQDNDSGKGEGSNQTEGLGQGNDSGGKGQGQGTGSGSGDNLSDTITGKDNIAEFCQACDIPLDCVADKLKISEEELYNQAGKLAKELGIEMFELRDIILSCQ